MRFAVYVRDDRRGLAVDSGDGFRGLFRDEPGYPGDLDRLVADQADLSGPPRPCKWDSPSESMPCASCRRFQARARSFVSDSITWSIQGKSASTLPDYPVVFARFASSLIGHGAPIAMPRQSTQLDYEGELVAVLGRGGKDISRKDALDHVAGYSIFNDVTVRDYQLRTSQWTVGKNFDGTGAFGPFFVLSEALPPGCKGLHLTTRLNDRIVQHAAIADMVFDVESLIVSLSEAFTLSAGDIIVTGTPGGIGMSRHPPLWMKPGDVCEVEISGLGVLRNSIIKLVMKMPDLDHSVMARSATIAATLRGIVGHEWVIENEAERRPYESDGLTAYSALPLLVVLARQHGTDQADSSLLP